MKRFVSRSNLGAHDFCQLLKQSKHNQDLIKKLYGKKCIIIVHLGDSQGADVLRAGRNSIYGCDFKDGHFDTLQIQSS